jgi:hypothetical protein
MRHWPHRIGQPHRCRPVAGKQRLAVIAAARDLRAERKGGLGAGGAHGLFIHGFHTGTSSSAGFSPEEAEICKEHGGRRSMH